MYGGRLGDISAACDEASSMADNKAVLIIYAGINDVINTRSEELLEKYRRMIQRYKCKSNKIILLGILPRINAPTAFYNRVFSTNKCT